MKPSLTVIRIGLSSLICTALLSACGPGFKSKNFTNAESDAYFKANPQFAHLDKRSKVAPKEDAADKDAAGKETPAPKGGGAPAGAVPADGAKSNTLGEAAPAAGIRSEKTQQTLEQLGYEFSQKIAIENSVIKGLRGQVKAGVVEFYAIADVNGDGNLVQMDAKLAANTKVTSQDLATLSIEMKDKTGAEPTALKSGVEVSAICSDDSCAEVIVRVHIAARGQTAVFFLNEDTRIAMEANITDLKSVDVAYAEMMGPGSISKGYEPADKPAQTSEAPAAQEQVSGQVDVSKTEEAPAAKGDLQEQVQEASEKANAKMDLTGVEQIVIAGETGIPASIAATDAQIEEVKMSDGGLVVLPEAKAALETQTAVEEKRTQVSFNGAIVNMTPSELKAKQAELAKVQQASLNEKVAKGRTAPTWQTGSQATELASKKNAAKTR